MELRKLSEALILCLVSAISSMPSHLTLTLLAFTLFLFHAVSAGHAQQPMLVGSAAVDAKGVRHTWDASSTKRPRASADLTKMVPPEYPYEARKSRQEGVGLFRIQLDLATGKVTKVTVLKSTGVVMLDNSAQWALRRWQMKPGRWRELDVPMAFTLSPPGTQFLPRRGISKPTKANR